MVKFSPLQMLTATGGFGLTFPVSTTPWLCRTYGAPDFLFELSHRFRGGLTYAAPTALVRQR
jgi:hypothetical protein